MLLAMKALVLANGVRSRSKCRHEENSSLQIQQVSDAQRRAKEQAALEVQRLEELRAAKRKKEEEATLKMIAEQQRKQTELTKRRMELDLKAKQEVKQAKEQKLAALSSAASASAQRSKSASERKKTDHQLETKATSSCATRSRSANERKKADPFTTVDSEIASARSESYASLDHLTHVRSTALREPDVRTTTTVAVMGAMESRRRLLANLLFVLGAWDRGALERFQAKELERRRSAVGCKVTVMRPPAVDLHPGRLALLESPSPDEGLGSAQAIIAHADVALLVVPVLGAHCDDAGMLASGSGQIWEQAVLIRASGVRTVIVAIDGMEDPRVSWRQSEFEGLREKLTLLFRRLGLFETLYVPISNIFRSFLKERHVEGVWFTGRSIIELIAESSSRRALGQTGRLAQRAAAEKDSPCFLPIEANYSSSSGIRSKVEGFVQSGLLRPGWKCVVMPSGQDCTVQEILSPEGLLLASAPAGLRVILRLASPLPKVALGEALCCGIDMHGVKQIKVALQILDTARDVPIRSGFQSTFCAFGGESPCELSAMFEEIDLETGTKRSRPEIAGTQTLLICALQLDRHLVLGVCTERNALGHFVLRMGETLIAAGWVVALARDVLF